MPQPEYVQRGYLREDFRLFHLKGPMEEQLDWHYHTFHKLIFFLGGTSSYGLEGRSYPLEAGDVILVPQGCVHRPEAAPGAPYERVILYLSAEFLSRAGGADCPLDSCFTLAKTSFRFVLRPQEGRQALRRTLFALESASAQPGFGQELLAKALVGREIAQNPAVLMAAYAVRGLDINTSYVIYNLLTEQKMKGVAVIYVGEDLDVLLELCDRILVLCGGKVSGIVDGRKTTKDAVGLMMTKIGG